MSVCCATVLANELDGGLRLVIRAHDRAGLSAHYYERNHTSFMQLSASP